MAPKRNLRAQPKKGGKKVESKRRGGSTLAPDCKCRRTTRQKSKAETESTKLPGHIPLSSPPSEMPIDAPKERIFQDADIFKVRAHSFGNPIEANKVITSVLTSEQLEKYRQTCFGHLLDMKNLRFSGQLVHHLLCRRVVSNNPEVLEFNFGGSGVRFTKWEFALISGLKFCRYPSMYDMQISKGKELLTRLLDDRTDLKLPELEQIFKGTHFVDDWDAVRIALLYFLVHGVLGMDPRVQINRKFIDLVADIEVFNSYPWGILSYNETINSFHNAFQHRGRAVKNKSQSYDLKGFPLAFQLWGFEAIPDFGNQFGERQETRCPRILRWHATSQPNHFAVHNWFTSNSNYVVHWRLDATDEEKTMDYWRTIAVNIHEVRYTAPPLVAPIATVGAKDASKAEEHSSGPPDANFRLACLEAKFDELKKEMASLRKMLSSVIDQQKHQAEHHMHSHSPSSSVRPSSPVAPSFGEQAEEFDAPIDGSNGRKEDDDCTTPFEPIIPGGPYVEDSGALVPYQPLHWGWDISASAGSPHHDQSDEIEVEDWTHNVCDTSRFGRVYHQSPHVISSYTDPCKKKVKFNLNRHIDASKERAFDEWFRVAPNEATVCTSYMMVGKKFFAELLTSTGWLTSDSSIKGRYPIWGASRSTYLCDSTLCSYVRGKSPKPSVPWRRCDYVYIPINNGGAHWLAACVDLKARHIDLYDPNMGNKYVQNKELNNAECLTYMLPYLLRDGGYYEKNPDVPPTLEPFTMTMIKDAPRQDNGGDCGVYALKFIEYKSSEETLSFGPEDIRFFRKKYAVDLYFNKFSM
ncbi:uncharacterized protein LOC107434762 isoform X2 [Ziziphus jujuba]|uniref:Uncharacterized protein LOC107434762 isoform X2 n=1 Tax=Ziziphus jujuba TaxID=326968 RepID=A0ABM3ZZC2_ZIZJJ|nr:uncharacterized protein LOC107434762 isoform X2 [Ziziphus jujuba]